MRNAMGGATKNSYTSASFNQTATGFRSNLGLTNLGLYSADLISTARVELERFINAI